MTFCWNGFHRSVGIRCKTSSPGVFCLTAGGDGYLVIIIIMVIFKCYFSGELIALSYKKNNNSGVNIELGKTYRLKALCMMEIKKIK